MTDRPAIPADGIDVLLHAYRPDHFSGASFLSRCHNAALCALAVRKLCVEQERIGPALVPIGEYIRALAEGAGVGLQAVLDAFHIDDLDCKNAAQAAKVTRLARALGMGYIETFACILLSFASTTSIPVELAFTRRRAERAHDSAEVYEEIVNHVKTEAEQAVRAEILLIERAVWAAFGGGEEFSPTDSV